MKFLFTATLSLLTLFQVLPAPDLQVVDLSPRPRTSDTTPLEKMLERFFNRMEEARLIEREKKLREHYE